MMFGANWIKEDQEEEEEDSSALLTFSMWTGESSQQMARRVLGYEVL